MAEWMGHVYERSVRLLRRACFETAFAVSNTCMLCEYKLAIQACKQSATSGSKQSECSDKDVQAFMGDVAMWTGIVTGTLMFASPLLFERWKWRGVAGATPAFMLWTGLPFFAGCIVYTLAHPGGGAGTFALRALVLAGALLQAGARRSGSTIAEVPVFCSMSFLHCCAVQASREECSVYSCTGGYMSGL